MNPGAENNCIVNEFRSFLQSETFPCLAAKSALKKEQIEFMVVDHMACPKDDISILNFLYSFVDIYRSSNDYYHSAAIIFKEPLIFSEEMFDQLLWKRLQALSDLDSKSYQYDKRVEPNPASVKFSFSLKEEAFFVIGLHNCSNRPARQFKYPVLIFNPHQQFEHLRETHHFEKMQAAIREREMTYTGSINPMLDDFGNSSEVFQYSGRKYDSKWACPLIINHERPENNSTA